MLTSRSFKPTFSAAEPEIPVSTSSKMRVSTVSVLARTVLIASIILESSPPDAIFATGRGVSPGFAEMSSSILSVPFEFGSHFSKYGTSSTFGIFKNAISDFTFVAKVFAAFLRRVPSFSAAASIFSSLSLHFSASSSRLRS